jgi:hypothetical protein
VVDINQTSVVDWEKKGGFGGAQRDRPILGMLRFSSVKSAGARQHLRATDVAVGDDRDGQGALNGGNRGEVGGAAPAVALAAALAAVDGDESCARLLQEGAEADCLGLRLQQADLACDGNRDASVHGANH